MQVEVVVDSLPHTLTEMQAKDPVECLADALAEAMTRTLADKQP